MLIFDIFIATAALISTILQYQVYRITKAKSMLGLLICFGYGAIVRILLCFPIDIIQNHSAIIIGPFWFGLTISMFFLLVLFEQFINGAKKESNTFIRVLRRFKRTK